MSVHLVVTYCDNTIMYYPVPVDQGWRVDAGMRLLVIGTGVPRTHVPLDQVRSFEVERCGCGADPMGDA